MQIHYLEIVTPDVDAFCDANTAANGVPFGDPDPLLGNARTTPRIRGTQVGVRAPMHESEEPVVRPYLLVDDIDASLEAAERQGAVIAHPPLEIPDRGVFAIYIQGGTHVGLWQL